MANPEHLAKLSEGVEAWNEWRRANPNIKPDLERAKFQDERLERVNLSDSNLQGADFVRGSLEAADLHGANFQEATLLQTDLRRARLIHANLRQSNLFEANLHGADLRRANLYGAKLRVTDLGEARLVQTDLRGADLREACLCEARLRQAKFQGANLTGAKLRRADLTETSFQGASLQRTDLEGADLRGANLTGADLRLANLQEANVTGVKFLRSSCQRAYQGIRVSTCYGSQMFKSFAQDQDYIEELRSSGGWRRVMFCLWWVSADCGRSFTVWAAWSLGLATGFGYLFYFWIGPEGFKFDHLPAELSTMIYYSVVTFTTLGFGDIKPVTSRASLIVMVEVIAGYVMLGGLISILANKLARRA